MASLETEASVRELDSEAPEFVTPLPREQFCDTANWIGEQALALLTVRKGYGHSTSYYAPLSLIKAGTLNQPVEWGPLQLPDDIRLVAHHLANPFGFNSPKPPMGIKVFLDIPSAAFYKLFLPTPIKALAQRLGRIGPDRSLILTISNYWISCDDRKKQYYGLPGFSVALYLADLPRMNGNQTHREIPGTAHKTYLPWAGIIEERRAAFKPQNSMEGDVSNRMRWTLMQGAKALIQNEMQASGISAPSNSVASPNSSPASPPSNGAAVSHIQQAIADAAGGAVGKS